MDSTTKAKLRKIRSVRDSHLSTLASVSELDAFIKNLPKPEAVSDWGLEPKQAYAADGLLRWAWSFVNVNYKRFIAEDPLVSPQEKLRLLREARVIDPEVFAEIVFHLKDVWAFTKPSQLDKLARLYLEVITSGEFEPKYCLDLALNLFERAYFDEYPKAFAHIIEDPASQPSEIIESCKYLLAQDELNYHSLAQEVFTGMVEAPVETTPIDPLDYESEFEDIDEDEDFSDPLTGSDSESDFLASSEDEVEGLEATGKEVPKVPQTLDERRAEWEAGHPERIRARKGALEAKASEEASKVRYDLIDAFFVRSRKKGPRGKPLFINYLKPRHKSKHLKPSETVNLLEFMAPVSLAFINNPTAYVKQRIVASSNFLASGVFEDCRSGVKGYLEGVASDQTNHENVRADAVDVLLMNAGSPEEDSKIRKVLLEIGLANVAASSGHSKVQDRIRTIYNNTQNAHDESVVASVLEYLNNLNVDALDLLEYQEIVRLLDRPLKALTPQTRHAVNSALYRIKVDRSVVGERLHEVSEIFSIVWAVIHRPDRPAEEVASLEKRFVEELADMGDTCAGGHVNRLIGVLQGFGFQMSISMTDQIVSNYAGRIAAKINALPEAQREDVNAGMIAAEGSDLKATYLAFIEAAFGEVKKELHREFVAAKFVSAPEFVAATEEARKSWF